VRSIEEIQAARAARKAVGSAAREEQLAKDLEALDALELEHGDDRVVSLELPAHIPGLPTIIVGRCPSKDYFKKFQDMVRRAKGDLVRIGPATDQLADVCLAYPDAETYKQVREAFPAIHDQLATAAAELARAKDSAAGNA
jgi:hypothetical protein